MLTYIIRRLLLMIPTLIGVTLVVFVIMAISPGGIGGTQLTMEGELDAKGRQDYQNYLNERYGVNDPLPVQYVRWLNNVSPIGYKDPQKQLGWPAASPVGLKWPDLGESFSKRRPVLELFAEALPITLLLNILATPIVYLIAIPAGLYIARHRGQDIDVFGGVFMLALWSIPPIWAGVTLIGYLANREYLYLFPTGRINSTLAPDMAYLPTTAAGWLGVGGFVLYLVLLSIFLFGLIMALLETLALARRLLQRDFSRSTLIATAIFAGSLSLAFLALWIATVSGLPHQPPADRGWLFDRLWHLVLPVICLVYGGFASLSKLMRGSLLESLSSHYIRTARAKGVNENDVLWRHAFRNSLLPLITVATGILPALLGGSVIIETIFSIPGMGLLTYEGIMARDRELVLAGTLISGVLGLLCILAADLAYAFADPRVSYE